MAIVGVGRPASIDLVTFILLLLTVKVAVAVKHTSKTITDYNLRVVDFLQLHRPRI